MLYKRIKVITSHAGKGRYLAEVAEEPVGWIPSPRDIPSPYAFSATTPVWRHESGKLVFIKETAHKRYEVYELTGGEPMTEEQAQEAWRA